MVRGLGAWLLSIPPSRRWWWPLFFINLVGSVYGFYWYREQLAVTPWYYWLFTPDCPLASTYFTLTLGLWLSGRRSDWFEAFTYVTSAYFGVWTVVVIAQYFIVHQTFDWANFTLLASHVGLGLEGFLFLAVHRVRLRHLGIASGWILTQWYFDYYQGTNPWLQAPELINQVKTFSWVWLLVLTLGLALAVRRRSDGRVQGLAEAAVRR